ncbi:uncharacterized protein [Eurosta solidaginis]|uniref:uncharacterized protein n=1 Tax=Eurosta solidaginis TaxID=178769 RepID=UPI003530CDE5
MLRDKADSSQGSLDAVAPAETNHKPHTKMSKTAKSTTSTRKSSHNYDDRNADHYDDMSDELSVSSSEEDVVNKRKSRKLQPTDVGDFEGGMYDRGGRRRRRGSKGGRKRRSRSRRRRR